MKTQKVKTQTVKPQTAKTQSVKTNTLKIKTFQFRISCASGNWRAMFLEANEKPDDAFKDYTGNYRIKTEADIDKEINDWVTKSKAEVVDIKTTTYTVYRHNNAWADTVIAIYTVLYR